MNNIQSIQPPSAFAQIVDQLRNKSERELKMLYLRLFQNELQDEWKAITKDANFKNSTENDIIKAIKKNRYR